MLVGANNNRGTASDFFSGSLDDAAVWNTELTDAEAKGLFNVANSSLKYNAKDAAALFGIFASGPNHEGDTSDGKTWKYATGLSGNAGDLVNGNTA